jgi:hypothetical protein
MISGLKPIALLAASAFAAFAAFSLAGRAAAQAPPVDFRCAYIELGQWLDAEPHMHCFDLNFTCQPGETFGCFKRPLVFEDRIIQGAGGPEKRVTAAPFGYVDGWGTHWDVPAGFETDGASIPPAFQPFIGGSWTEHYVRAAVLHDFYIRRLTSNPEAVHRLFFDALLASGTAPDRAKIMYWAVRNFGPQWKNVDLPAYERDRQQNLERIRRENEVFRAEYSACLARHLDALRVDRKGSAWEQCPLDNRHQFILDLMTTARDVVEESAGTMLENFKAGRCVEVAPDKYE